MTKPAAPAVSIQPKANIMYKAVLKGVVNIRDGIELSSREVGTLPQGTRVQISERQTNSEGVVRLRLADGRGWVSERLSSGNHDHIMVRDDMGANDTYTVVYAQGAIMRDGLELSSNQVGTLPKGTRVKVRNESLEGHTRCLQFMICLTACVVCRYRNAKQTAKAL